MCWNYKMEYMYAASHIIVSSSLGIWNLFLPRVFLEAKETRKQIIWSGALPVPQKNFPSWQQPRRLSIDHKPTCLFFLIGKLMSIVDSSKIHAYIWTHEEWSFYQEFWFSLTSSFATSLLNCSWTTSPLFFLWNLTFRVWRTPWWCLMPHRCCVLSLQRRTFLHWRKTLPSNTAITPSLTS